MIKLKFKSLWNCYSIFKCSNKSHFCIFFIKFFFHIYKKCLKIHQLNINKIRKNKCRDKAFERHQSLSKEEKEKKQQYGHETYKNLLENKKQKLFEYRKKYYKMRKIVFTWNR